MSENNSLKSFALPMVQVIDAEHYEQTGVIRLVKCAVLRDRADSWLVKPIHDDYFDVNEWLDANTAFNMAWWSVSKSGSEPISETFDVSVLHPLVIKSIMSDLEYMWKKTHS